MKTNPNSGNTGANPKRPAIQPGAERNGSLGRAGDFGLTPNGASELSPAPVTPLQRFNNALQWRLYRAVRWLGDTGIRPLAVMAQFRARMNRWPRIVRSGGINDHLAVVRAFRRFDARHVVTADKYAARDWVAQRVGAQVLNQLHQVFDCAEALDYDALPGAFALKATHMAGGNYLVPVKNRVSRDELVKFCETQLRCRFGTETYEDHYLEIPPRMIVESWLGSPSGALPEEYKFYVFRGRPLIVLVGQDRDESPSWTLFDTRWNRLRVSHPVHPVRPDLPKPESLARMLDIAATLGRDFDFCRIDLYEVDQRVIFGEITHTPAAGYLRHDPPEFDEVMGRLIKQPDPDILRRWTHG